MKIINTRWTKRGTGYNWVEDAEFRKEHDEPNEMLCEYMELLLKCGFQKVTTERSFLLEKLVSSNELISNEFIM